MHGFLALCRSILAASLLSGALSCAGSAPLPKRALALNKSGTEALMAGDLETAEARFSLALEYSPRFVEALVNLALVEMERGNLERARQLLSRASGLNPDVAQPHHGLGVLAERMGQPDDASRHYFAALAVDPGFGPARANLARLFNAAGDYERARVQFKRLIAVAPDDPEARAGLCATLIALRRVPEADRALAEASRRFPESPRLALLEARRSLRAGQLARARTLLLPISRRSDDLATRALAWLAVAELAAGRLGSAVRRAEAAIDRDPEEEVAVYALALALHQRGERSAHQWLRRANKLSPNVPEIRRALARY